MPSLQSVKFILEGAPIGKGRPRACRTATGVRMYQAVKTERYESLVRDAWRAVAPPNWTPHEGPVRLTLKAYFSIPKSRPKWWRELAEEDVVPVTTRPDIDNILKVFSDGLNGVAWRDDAQIVAVSIDKRYSSRPRLEVEVEFCPAVSKRKGRRGWETIPPRKSWRKNGEKS